VSSFLKLLLFLLLKWRFEKNKKITSHLVAKLEKVLHIIPNIYLELKGFHFMESTKASSTRGCFLPKRKLLKQLKSINK
jgi:hypothetical protein